MTRDEWLTCTDPKPMLEFLRGKATDRKLRLFAVACCRRTASAAEAEWTSMAAHGRSKVEVDLIKSEAELARKAADLAERYADGLASLAELQALLSAPGDDEAEGCYADGADAAWAAKASAYRARWCATYYSPSSYPRRSGFRSASPADHDREQSAQCGLLRDLFGDPFRPAVFDLAWLTRDVVRRAEAVYDGRDFGRLPELAEALVQAGCIDSDLVFHCRRPGEHVRGCWAVDLLLGKE